MDKFKHTLLIVDYISLELLTDIFKDNYNILTSDSGENALSIMKEQTDIDVVVLDMSMPETDGYQVLEIMKKDERLKFIPVIAITSSDDSDAEIKAVELGAADFICRPFNIKTLKTRVDSVICRHESEKIKPGVHFGCLEEEYTKLIAAESAVPTYSDTEIYEISDNINKKHDSNSFVSNLICGSNKEENNIVAAEDVTFKRAAAKNRIEEHKANALTGLYDEIFKIDYRKKSSILVYCRNNSQKAENAKPVSLDYICGEWTDKKIHPEDREKARTLFNAPAANPDFTDFYSEIRIGVPHAEGQYKTYGMVMVRSAADSCMLFNRDMDRIYNSAAFYETPEINRLLQPDAEQTNLDDVSDQAEASRRQEVQDQMYQLLLEETGTIIFNYNNENDELYYYQPLNPENRKTESINNYSDNFKDFYILEPEDRIKFAGEIQKLSQKSSSSELVLTINIDGYPRRFRSFLKSMEDNEGKVFRIIGKIEDVDEEMNRLDKIKAKAMYDSLCVDIYNKSTTEELIKAELDRSGTGALIMIDVDDFKSINDRLGHIFGDEFLKKFASTIKSIFRDSDIVGRYGGDEFFVYLSHASAALAVKKSEQILEKVTQITIPEIGFVKSSIGVAAVNPDNRIYHQILKQADSALYTAKNRGKNQVVLFDSATMSEGTYRTEVSSNKGAGKGRTPLSSNPQNSASIILRSFSVLYSSQDLSMGINQMLAMVGQSFDVSRAYIFEDTEDGKYCCNTFEWCNEGVAPEIDTLQQVSYEKDLGGNYRENMNDDGIFYCHDVSVLKSTQRAIFERQNIKSVLQCAIMDNGVFKGFVGFDECRNSRFWTQGQIDALVFISKVLSIFLLKDRNRRLTENYAKSIKSILDNYPQHIYIVEKETTKLLYLNVMAQTAIGGNPIGAYCSDAICGQKNETLCPICALKREGYSKSIDMMSPVLHKMIKAQAAEVEWEGKKAYLITCMLIDE